MIAEELINQYQSLFEIDGNLDRLVKKIELLNYVNPLNIEHEKKKFFSFACPLLTEPTTNLTLINCNKHHSNRQ